MIRDKILGNGRLEEWLDYLKAMDSPNQYYCSTFNCWRPLNQETQGSSDTAGETDVLICPKCGLGKYGWCRELTHPGKECVSNVTEGMVSGTYAVFVAVGLSSTTEVASVCFVSAVCHFVVFVADHCTFA